MNRRQFLSTLSAIAMPAALQLAGPAAAGGTWALLSSPALKPGTTRIRIPVDQGRAILSGLKLGVDGNALTVRKILLHRGPRSLTMLDFNRQLVPGREMEAIFPPDAPFRVKAISLEYEVHAAGAVQTVLQVWVTDKRPAAI